MPRPYVTLDKLIMGYKNDLYNRQSNRLQDFDYSSPGAYFVTILSYQRLPIFGKIRTGEVHLSQIGRIIENCLQDIPIHFNGVLVDAYVIMPNHLHGIININEHQFLKSAACFYSMKQFDPFILLKDQHEHPKGTPPKSLGAIIGSFKSASTKYAHRLGLTHQKTIWHRNYYEHIIRDDEDYHRIVEYIQLNPSNWANDQEFVLI